MSQCRFISDLVIAHPSTLHSPLHLRWDFHSYLSGIDSGYRLKPLGHRRGLKLSQTWAAAPAWVTQSPEVKPMAAAQRGISVSHSKNTRTDTAVAPGPAPPPRREGGGRLNGTKYPMLGKYQRGDPSVGTPIDSLSTFCGPVYNDHVMAAG